MPRYCSAGATRCRIILGLGVVLPIFAGCANDAAFTDVTTEANLQSFIHATGARGDLWMPEPLGSGVAFLDWTGDAWPDIMVASGGTWDSLQPPAVRLYRNMQDGRFLEITKEAGLDSIRAFSLGVAAADVDNDGDPDAFVTTLGTNLLLLNNDGVFTDVSLQAGIGESTKWSTAALFFDADRDGLLDLYVGNYVDWSPSLDAHCTGPQGQNIYCTPHLYSGVQHHLYRNLGDITFEDVTLQAGLLPTPGKTLGAVTLDVNHDQWPDLAVANDLAPDQLYINNGDGSFTEKGVVGGIAFDSRGIATAGMGIHAGYIDASGEPAIVVGNFSNQMIGMFRHTMEGRFMDVSASSGIGGPSRLTLAFGLLLLDTNLDGHQDIFVANGHIHQHVESSASGITYKQQPHLFVNDGHGAFTDHGSHFPPMLGRGAAYADMDQDGDLDIVVTENGGRLRLWRNNADGKFIRVMLEGTVSNRDGSGAQLVLYAQHGHQVRFVEGGGSYLSQSERYITFGMNSMRRADSLVIRWPSGKVQTIHSLTVDSLLMVTEPL